jgi:tetratricopeptide (TPR) repeat protein
MTFFPNFTEFLVLAMGSVGACAAGAIVFWLWSLRSRSRTFTVTVAALLLGCAVFGFAQYTLYRAADARWQDEVTARANAAAAVGMIDTREEGHHAAEMAAIEQGAQKGVEARHMHIFLYGMAFALLPLWYFTRALATSIAEQPIESAFAMNTVPGERGPFRAAQALALRGDIEGAVEQYRSYSFKQDEATLSAARLLQNDGRFNDAAALYIEVMENYPDTVRSWSEAAYELAKLKESAFGERQEALKLLNQVMERNPEGEYGHMAIRLHRRILSGQQDSAPGSEALMASLDAQFESSNPPTIDPPGSTGPAGGHPSTT